VAKQDYKCDRCGDERSKEKVETKKLDDGRRAKVQICPNCEAFVVVEYLTKLPAPSAGYQLSLELA